MTWDDDAKAMIKKVPFFIRKKVISMIEERVAKNGSTQVTTADVEISRSYFLKKFDKDNKDDDKKDITLWEIELCRGKDKDCPFLVDSANHIKEKIEDILNKKDFTSRRKEKLDGLILPHHKFKISISTCPNGCSQPQIKDIGIISQAIVEKVNDECTNCKLCQKTCKEDAIRIQQTEGELNNPVIDYNKCVNCGMCVKVCPQGTLKAKRLGFRLLAGGKLGRHPMLAREIVKFCEEKELIQKIEELIELFLKEGKKEEKMADVLRR